MCWTLNVFPFFSTAFVQNTVHFETHARNLICNVSRNAKPSNKCLLRWPNLKQDWNTFTNFRKFPSKTAGHITVGTESAIKHEKCTIITDPFFK